MFVSLVVNVRFPFSCINSNSSKYLLTRCTLISKLRYDFMRFTNGLNMVNNKRQIALLADILTEYYWMFDQKEKELIKKYKRNQCGKYFFGWNIMLIIITFPAILLNFSVFHTFNIRNQIRRSALATYTLYRFRFKWMWGSDFDQLVLKL